MGFPKITGAFLGLPSQGRQSILGSILRFPCLWFHSPHEQRNFFLSSESLGFVKEDYLRAGDGWRHSHLVRAAQQRSWPGRVNLHSLLSVWSPLVRHKQSPLNFREDPCLWLYGFLPENMFWSSTIRHCWPIAMNWLT